MARHITQAHVDITGAPIEFVNVFFSEHADEEGGFRERPAGKVVFVSGNIRSGRDDKTQAELQARIIQGIVDALACERSDVSVVLNSGAASHVMEGGKVLPEPGSPEEAAWKEASRALSTNKGAFA